MTHVLIEAAWRLSQVPLWLGLTELGVGLVALGALIRGRV